MIAFGILRKQADRCWGGLVLLASAVAISCAFAAFPLRAEDESTPINVGILTGPAPYYAFSEATGEPIGFALEMWTAIAKRAGLSYQISYFDSVSDLHAAAVNKTIDVVPLLVMEPGSSALFNFTDTVHQSPVSIFVRKNRSDISRLSDLAGHRVSVIKKHVGQALMHTYRGELSIVHDNLDEALSALMTRTSDAVVYQEHIMWQLARQQGVDSLLRTVAKPLRKLDMAIAVRKDRPDLLSEIVPALASYKQSKAYFAAREPWGGNPPPLIEPSLVAKLLGALLAVTIVVLGMWRHFSLVRVNRALARSIQEQQSAEERFKDVAEAASDWFFEQDKNLKFTFVSSRFQEMTGIPPSRLIGQTRWGEGLSGSAAMSAQWRDHIATLHAHEDWRDFIYTLTAEDGQQRTITTSGKAVFDTQGNFVGYRGVGRDITRRIELEGALQQAQKMELVGQLTGGIAHDFNNLLTVMVGNLEMLKRNLREDKRSQVYVETASEAVDIGAQLVQRLLGFSRRQSLHPTKTNLNNLVSGMMRLVLSSIGPTIETKLALGAELPSVFADEAQLQNALLNLAINARDAMPNGGKLTIETAVQVVDQAFVDQYPSAITGRYLVLRIEDTGTGIAKHDLTKVIEPFFTTKEVGKGSGLGLSTVYGFAKQSNGFLLIDSEEGVGTSVSVYLPVAEVVADDFGSQVDEKDIAELDAPAEPTGHTVLVVEDDARVREITVTRLHLLGYHVLDVEDARAALDTLKKCSNVDLLLTDIMMPGGMSGIDLAQEVGRSYPDIKILFSAAYSQKADELNEKGKLGPWLRKPYRQADLAQKMREVLEACPTN